MAREVLALNDPERARREREADEALVRDGALSERAARAFLGDCARSTLYAWSRDLGVRTVKIGTRRLWPIGELRRVLREHLEEPE
jgi:hypothetical protein